MASNVPPSPGANGPYTALPSNAVGAQGAILPSAGHYAEMQMMLQNLDMLSGWLQQNREDFDGLREGLGRVERMGGRQPRAVQHLENGIEGGEDEDQSQTIYDLRSELDASKQRTTQLETTLASFQTLHSQFNTTLSETMRLVRNYTYTQQTHTTDLHRHYTKLLQDARYETLEAQLIHQKWQEGLTKVSESIRDAVKAREKEADEGGWRAEVKGLRLENRLLRRKVGWEIRPDSDDEFEEEVGEDEEHGRGSRSSLGLTGGSHAVIT